MRIQLNTIDLQCIIALSCLGQFVHAEANREDLKQIDFQFPVLERAATKTPFPDWLSAFTGLKEWPGLDPPYIPLDFIDFSQIPDYKEYDQNHCDSVPRDSCSFDCHHCTEHDDVYTCSKLSQTFDDGPSASTTKLLDRLKHNSTFFNLGVNIVQHPDIYQRMQKEGHLIGSHTWSQVYLPNVSNEKIIAQIEWSIWAMNATGNHTPKWFRPPYGGIDNRVRAITRQFGLQAVLWDHDTFDWSLLLNDSVITEQEILQNVINWNKSGTGLILEHDSTEKTVDLAIKINKLIGDDQSTVSHCVGGIDYIKEFLS
ncbi:CDA2 [Saccharomyces cerevisiae synthetic construct]|nr:CDA2 [Saccharomyces cerevisiae synthetic construct]